MTTTDWLGRRTFHHSDYEDLKALMGRKDSSDTSVSVCIPALNEEPTLRPIVRVVREELMERIPLVDELVVVDSRSEDATASVAEEEGAVVIQDDEVLPSRGSFSGKGEAMWKSLFVLKGDIIVWMDADIENFHPRFVYGPVGALLTDPDIVYSKAFYDRPIREGAKLKPTGGGRVTELMARPLLNMFWPHLAGIVQPLSGEYAGRRAILEQVPFFTGYGVETGLLIDIAERFGVDSMAQVDLDVRVHRNRTLEELSRMASAILQTALIRLTSSGRVQSETELGTALMQFERQGDEFQTRISDILIQERPPAVTVPEYAGT